SRRSPHPDRGLLPARTHPSKGAAMSIRMKKSDPLPTRLGAFKPVDHVVVTLEDDAVAAKTAKTLVDGGFDGADVIVLADDELAERLHALINNASGAAGFGSEIQAMRAYLKLAEEGAGWVIVYAPGPAATERVGEIARRFEALQARKYNVLTVEELL